MNNFIVKSAAYGALKGGDQNRSKAAIVTEALQIAIDSNDGVVSITNDTFGVDPAPGVGKHFGAVVTINGRDYAFAAAERQTIDFQHYG